MCKVSPRRRKKGKERVDKLLVVNMKTIYRGGKNNTVVLLAYNRQNFEQIAFDAVYAKKWLFSHTLDFWGS